jgi:type II secretory pathway component HofQ
LASELLPLARTALAGEGSATVDAGTNSLVLSGEGPALDRALELLDQQDRSLHTVVVHYESRRVEDLEDAGLRVDWQVEGGDVRAGNLLPTRSGANVVPQPEASPGREQAGAPGVLRVFEGRTGRIAAGTEAPAATRTLTPYGVDATTTPVQVESGLEVTPHVLGDGRVRLDLASFDARLAARLLEGPVVQGAAETSVTVSPGEKVALGRVARGSARGGGFLSRIFGGRSREERVLVVWVEVE